MDGLRICMSLVVRRIKHDQYTCAVLELTSSSVLQKSLFSILDYLKCVKREGIGLFTFSEPY